MIINCPECNHEVSDKAEMCPNCGCPIKAEGKEKPKIITIEHTKKKYKLQRAFAFMFFVLGVIFISTDKSEKKGLTIFGIFLIFIAVTLSIISAVGTRWDHA